MAQDMLMPYFYRLKDSRQLVIDGQRIRRVGISSVLVENVTAADAGLYTCRASNPQNASDITVAVNINGQSMSNLRVVNPFFSAPPHIIPSVQDRIAVETVDVEVVADRKLYDNILYCSSTVLFLASLNQQSRG